MEIIMHGVYSLLNLLTEHWALFMMAASLIFAAMNHFDEWFLGYIARTTQNESHSGVGALVIFSGLFSFLIATAFLAYSLWTGDQHSSVLIGHHLAWQAIGVGMLEAVWLIPYFYAIGRSGALEAAPLFQSIPIFSLLLGLLVFGESSPLLNIIGSVVIVSGGYLLNLVPGTWKLDVRTIAMMGFSSAVIAFIYFVFKDTALAGNFVATAFWSGIGTGISSLLLLAVVPSYRQQFVRFMGNASKLAFAGQLVNETLNIASVLLSRRAMMLGPSVVAVSALNAYQPVFILILGWILAKFGITEHGERLRGFELLKRSGAIALIALGTVLIAL